MDDMGLVILLLVIVLEINHIIMPVLERISNALERLSPVPEEEDEDDET